MTDTTRSQNGREEWSTSVWYDEWLTRRDDGTRREHIVTEGGTSLVHVVYLGIIIDSSWIVRKEV